MGRLSHVAECDTGQQPLGVHPPGSSFCVYQATLGGMIHLGMLVCLASGAIQP
jgi:hypothetical protein